MSGNTPREGIAQSPGASKAANGWTHKMMADQPKDDDDDDDDDDKGIQEAYALARERY